MPVLGVSPTFGRLIEIFIIVVGGWIAYQQYNAGCSGNAMFIFGVTLVIAGVTGLLTVSWEDFTVSGPAGIVLVVLSLILRPAYFKC